MYEGWQTESFQFKLMISIAAPLFLAVSMRVLSWSRKVRFIKDVLPRINQDATAAAVFYGLSFVGLSLLYGNIWG